MGWKKILIGLVIIALLGLCFGLVTVYYSQKKWKIPPIPFPPPKPPFSHYVAGMGRVDTCTHNISIGVPFGEIVKTVYVNEGSVLKAGDPIFALDDQKLLANLEIAKATLATAQATYARSLSLPRPEDVPPVIDTMNAAEANFLNFNKQFELYDRITDSNAISQIDYITHKYSALQAKHQLLQAQDNLALLKAGAWIRDLEIYRSQIKEAEAQIQTIQVDIERSIIRAPVDGTILQVNICEGNFAEPFSVTSTLSDALVVFGTLSPLHLWVDIDEEDIWRVIEGAKGVAYIRGNSSICTPINFLRIQPLVIPKPLFTGDNTERVDTRVLELIYEFERGDLPVYPGQVMDVYLEAKPLQFQ